MTNRSIAALMFLIGTLAACEASAPVRPSARDAKAPSLSAAAVDAAGNEVVTGTAGPGARYELSRPQNWNGRLVLYAHGYIPAALPLGFDGNSGALRTILLQRGYGFARSTYSENGYALKDGVQRTRQLRGLFADAFGAPKHTYVMGVSLGGAVTLMLAEKNPGLFDGALAMCTFGGGGQTEVDYIMNVRLLFDYYFPGVLAAAGGGDDALVGAPNVDYARVVAPRVAAAITANAASIGKAIELAGVDQVEIRFNSVPELVNSIVQVLGFAVLGVSDLVGRVHGRAPFDNIGVHYSGSRDDDALNAGIRRVASSKDAENYVEHYYQPDGRLRIPVLTLHSTRDPVVPFAHEAAYAATVAGAGRSDMLVQRAFDVFGHCTFGTSGAATIAEEVRALEELVAWAEAGRKPAP